MGKQGGTHERSFPAFTAIQEIPVINIIINVAVVLHDLREQISKEIIIGSFFESELPDIVEVDGKFLCKKK